MIHNYNQPPYFFAEETDLEDQHSQVMEKGLTPAEVIFYKDAAYQMLCTFYVSVLYQTLTSFRKPNKYQVKVSDRRLILKTINEVMSIYFLFLFEACLRRPHKKEIKKDETLRDEPHSHHFKI